MGRCLVPTVMFGALLVPTTAQTTLRSNPWAAVATPSTGPARSIGGYSNGCVQGAEALPRTGDGYQVARPSRNRHFGHPHLIAFIQELARSMRRDDPGVLFVGDLGQPRGGPAPSGHKSHQTGLDADLWFWYPAAASASALPAAHTEKLAPRSLVQNADQRPTRFFTPRVHTLVRRAASDPRVDRIFVHPVIKRELCTHARSERQWLRKVRPWWGHDAHFHVRLRCPDSSADCIDQAEVPAGDGCDALAWWFDAKAQADRKKGRRRYRKGMGSAASMPAPCNRMIK